MSEDEWDKCWAVNVKGQHALLKAALPTFNKNAEGGVFIITSSVAAQSLGGSSMVSVPHSFRATSRSSADIASFHLQAYCVTTVSYTHLTLPTKRIV